MILQLISWGCLLATVQSGVTSLEICRYPSSNTTCSEGVVGSYCFDVCELEKKYDTLLPGGFGSCNEATCDALRLAYRLDGLTSWDQCFLDTWWSDDARMSCEEDGVPECDGDQDLCQTVCFSTDGQCNECYDIPLDMATYDAGGLDCDTYESLIPTYITGVYFPGFCECFNYQHFFSTMTDTMIGCPSSCVSGSSNNTGMSGSSDNTGMSGSSDNTGMIIGIVVGAVALVGVVIAVVICMKMKRRKL